MAIFRKLHKRSGVEWYYVRFCLADGRRKVQKAVITQHSYTCTSEQLPSRIS